MARYYGNGAPNDFAGSWGDDFFRGNGGDDTAFGWDGNDALYGGAGNDFLVGGLGDDIVTGGDGDDNLQGSGGNDALHGGAGNDILVDNYPGGGGNSLAYGGAGDDRILFDAEGNFGTIFGGAGKDRLEIWGLHDRALGLDMTLGQILVDRACIGTFDAIEALRIAAGAGNDVILAGAGDDLIEVGAGQNRVEAGAGNDLVSYVTRGASTLDGGAGLDRLQVIAADGPLYFFVDGSGGLIDDGQLSQITGFETYDAVGSWDADVASLGAGHDSFRGSYGNDTVRGNGGHDRLLGEEGCDLLEGNDGRDILRGGAGNDLLYGGAGADTLGGGPGQDTIHGGAGADSFVFARNGVALLADFTSGEDEILIDHGLTTAPAGAAVLLSIGAASGAGAQFVLTDHGHERWLSWTDGGTERLILRLAEGAALLASDITLT